jgi:hypothetical protein|nr:MAG TPA: hypothetical protein [Caudoviricetes sp.]
MSNSKTTRQENLNKYADMLHRQNVSGEKPKSGEVKNTKPFEEEKEIKMKAKETVELESMSMEEALVDEETKALSANVLKECYQLIRAKIEDKLLDEHKAEITEECTDESMTAMRSYLATMPEKEIKELVSDVVKEMVDSQLFNTISEVVQETEEKLEAADVKVDLMEEAKKAILEKAEEIEEKAFGKNQEVKTESNESVESSTESETVIVETEEESPKPNGFVWPMGKFSEMFPG